MKLYSTILISTCCVCKKHYDVKPAHGGEGGESHGYCRECYEKLSKKFATSHHHKSYQHR